MTHGRRKKQQNCMKKKYKPSSHFVNFFPLFYLKAETYKMVLNEAWETLNPNAGKEG